MLEHQYNALVELYDRKKDLHEELTTQVERILRDLINNKKIDYLNITSRTKTLKSFVEKVGRKGYRDPERDLTDLSGVRVITYIESDVRKISDLIKSSFDVRPEKSTNKTDELGVDRVGYRSVHFVCSLPEGRLNLPELSKFKDTLFEIQVRTMLQHAWAEIHYSRDYKFSSVLPKHIRRRLYCMAGTLELVDMDFAALAREVDNYADEVTERISEGDFNIDINTTSLLKYLPIRLRSLERRDVTILKDNDIPKTIIEELENFGIDTLLKLDKILTEIFFEAIVTHQSYTTYAGLLRDAMLYADIDRYFSVSWKNNWWVAESYTFEMLSDKYGDKRVLKLFRENNITWN